MKGLIGCEVKRLHNLIGRFLECQRANEKPDDVAFSYRRILGFLYKNRDRDDFQKDIEQQFSLRGSSASQLLKRMEGASLIRRVSVDGDKRLKKIVLTRLAEENCERHLKEIKRLEGLLSKDITDKELVVFFSVVEKIEKNIDKELCKKSKKEV
ncbi:MAG: MarR family transcriptional regulator [Clostridia bacterium]|nr:MarR family transcriptional regulator [Clostridia bacterium]